MKKEKVETLSDKGIEKGKKEGVIGRWSYLSFQNEVSDLEYGMDFRHPRFRREVFLRFYEFHLKYQAHAGAVYYMFPYIFQHEKMNAEQRLWFTFINGCCQNVVTTYLIWKKFPDMHRTNVKEISAYFRKHYAKFGWDIDRRYVKNQFEDALQSYYDLIGLKTQKEYFAQYVRDADKYNNFNRLWDVVINNFHLFGRLATFSYLEYLRLAGLNLDCSSLFLNDLTGSKSHRNGLCKVLGRDDLDWYKDNIPEYTDDIIRWLEKEAEILLEEARHRIKHKDVSYFTLETTLCCYKSWHRPNRRYPNVYNDMFYDRIKSAEEKWGKLDIFWKARKETLPRYLLLEYNPKDKGLSPMKQNHYLRTGEVIMMNNDFDCFQNNYNEWMK